jgi:hypothetical protein
MAVLLIVDEPVMSPLSNRFLPEADFYRMKSVYDLMLALLCLYCPIPWLIAS